MEDCKETKEQMPIVEVSASSSKDLKETLPEDAFNNFLQGKRHILVQDYHSAVQSLSTACEMYTQHFGEMALECAELHFLYGKALFRLSQQQSGVLGGALNTAYEDEEEDEDGESDEGKDDEEEEESKETEESEKTDTDAENQESEPAVEEDKEPSESTDSPQPVVDASSSEPSEKEPSAQEGDAPLTKEGKAEEQAEAEEDDLELAWNSLETAKSIFIRQGKDNVEAQLKIADILQLLAEISMESDNNVAAITDLKECLSIKKAHLKPDDRILAETYYQMGLAQMLEKMYLDALDNFTTTMKILELRIENLKKKEVSDEPGSFERADCEKEIEELEGILADIKEKIEDTKELIEDAKKDVAERIATKAVEMEKEEFPSPVKSDSKPVSNITHLLKRKKPEQDGENERDAKRTKLSSTVQNGGDTVVAE